MASVVVVATITSSAVPKALSGPGAIRVMSTPLRPGSPPCQMLSQLTSLNTVPTIAPRLGDWVGVRVGVGVLVRVGTQPGPRHVVGVAVGYASQGGKATPEIGLVVMVDEKLPPDQLDPQDMIPSELDGVRVDVQETGVFSAG